MYIVYAWEWASSKLVLMKAIKWDTLEIWQDQYSLFYVTFAEHLFGNERSEPKEN